jgi:hypothetical protein
VTDEGQRGYVHQPEHYECEHDDDHAATPTAFVHHLYCLVRRQVHPLIIGRPTGLMKRCVPV